MHNLLERITPKARALLYAVRPIVSTALGALLAYYAFYRVFLPAFLLLLTLSSLLRVLSSLAIGKRVLRYAAFSAACFLCGFVMGAFERSAEVASKIVSAGQDAKNVHTITGRLLSDPRLSRKGRGMGDLALHKAAGRGVKGTQGEVTTSGSGTILVLFPDEVVPRIKEFGRGSLVTVSGQFAKDADSLFIAKSAFVVEAPSTINQLRTLFRITCVNLFSPYKWGGLSLALLIGIRDNLDGELYEQYQNSGIAYILALSGMHMAIISAIISFLLKKPLGLKAAALAGAALILVYVYIAGAEASLVRSAIMYLAGTVIVLGGFKKDTFAVLCLSFLVQLALKPASGASLSFILSYTALVGILLFTKPIDNLFTGYIPRSLRSSLSTSLAAFTATIAITALYFGTMRPAGILCGLFVVPLTTVFMVASIAFPVLSLVPIVKNIASMFIGLLYDIMEKIVTIGGVIPPLDMKAAPALFLNIALIAGIALGSAAMDKRRLRWVKNVWCTDNCA